MNLAKAEFTIHHLGEKWDAGELDESGVWFLEEEEIGLNRPLMETFVGLSEKNQAGYLNSICFVISLNRYGESKRDCIEAGIESQEDCEKKKSFQLTLLKNGLIVIEGFRYIYLYLWIFLVG